MMRVDPDALEYDVKPQIKNISKYLELGSGSLASISIPSDFSYRSKLINISQVVTDINNRINSIGNWLNTQINNFNDAEYSNKGLVENIGRTSLISSMDGNTYSFGANGEITLDSNIFYDQVKSSINNAYDYLLSGEWYKDYVDMMKKIGAKIVENVKAVDAKSSKNSKKSKSSKSTKSSKEIFNLLLSGKWYKESTDMVKKTLTKTGASTANGVIGIIKVFGEVVEDLSDVGVILNTCRKSSVTGVRDGITYLYALATDNTEEWNSQTKKMWKDTMAYVAEEHVENLYKELYNTAPGQWIDKNAYSAFKSDGKAMSIISSVGEYTLPVFSEFAVAYLTKGAVYKVVKPGQITAFLAGVARMGKTIEEDWGEKRDSSWVGIQKKYESGKISEEDYTNYFNIRTSDEYWQTIKDDYLNGNLEKDEFEKLKQIRELPEELTLEDWATLENCVMGIFHGAFDGTMEGAIRYVGAKIGDLKLVKPALGNVGIRITADTILSLPEIPIYTLTDAAFTEDTLDEAWNERGGWKGILMNALVSLTGSTIGEVVSGIKGKKNIANSDSKVKINGEAEPKIKMSKNISEIEPKIKMSKNISEAEPKIKMGKNISEAEPKIKMSKNIGQTSQVSIEGADNLSNITIKNVDEHLENLLGKDVVWDKDLTLEQKNILVEQINRFNEIKNSDIKRVEFKTDAEGKVILDEGTLLHGTIFDEAKLKSIKEKGILSTEFNGGWEEGETFYCADFYRVPEKMKMKEYVDFCDTPEMVGVSKHSARIEASKLPSRKCCEDETIAFIISPNKEIDDLLAMDVYRDNIHTENMKEIVSFDAIDNPGLYGLKDRLASPLYGVPENTISGIWVGDDIKLDIDRIKFLEEQFPDLYIIDSEGKILYDPSWSGNKVKINYANEILKSENTLMQIDKSGKLVGLYNNGIKTGSDYITFLTYEEHNFGHINRVADRSLETLKAVYELIDTGQVKGLGKIYKDIIYKAALCHDLGMGYPVLNKDFEVFISDMLEGGEIRKAHAINSAVAVAQLSDLFGEDTELIATLVNIHSKSTSGVKTDIFDDVKVSEMVEKLYKNSKKVNYNFRIEKLVETDINGNPIKVDGAYKFKEGILENIRTGAIVLRESDANALKTGFNQAGEDIKINKSIQIEKELAEYTDMLEQDLQVDEILDNLIDIEVQNSLISIAGRNGEIELDGDVSIGGQTLKKSDVDFSKKIILGEHNRICRNVEVRGDSLVYHYDVTSIENPACTFGGILENMEEYKSYSKIKQTVDIHLPEDTPDEVLQLYKKISNVNDSPINIEILKGEKLWN